MAVKVCLECGKSFEVFGPEYRQNHALYCSVECGKKYRRKAKGEADAIYAKMEAEAKGMREMLSAQAEGLAEIVKAASK